MNIKKLPWHGLALFAFSMLASLFVTTAHAVPSYARQTGSACADCHIAGFGPQLTPYGTQFKLGGYTDTDGKGVKVPLSAMLVANWTKTSKDLPEAPQHFNSNDNAAVQEVSAFLAGRLTDNIGTFIQSTYSGVDRKSSLDQLDIRYASPLKLGGQEGIVGVSLNNNPTLTDPFNSMGQWRFPYTESDFGFGTGPSPMVESLGGSVVGLNAYTLWDKNFYAEFGLYDTLSKHGLSMVNADDPGKFKNLGKYWRVAYYKDMKRDNFSVGLYGFNADLQPDRNVPGPGDHYSDIGIDAGYQFLGNREHIYTVNASYVWEKQNLKYTYGLGDSDKKNNDLNKFQIAASYHYAQTWGITGSLFDTTSSKDATLNSSSYNGRTNTSGYMLQGDWTPWGKESSWAAPWANVRLGVQYTGYNKYEGGNHYIDDLGNDRKARDNNTLSFFLWTAI